MLKNKRNLIIIAVLSLITGMVTAAVFVNKNLKVVYTYPKDNEEQVPVNTVIEIQFDKNISLSQWTVSSSPIFEFNLKAENNKLTVSPKNNLKKDTPYKVEFTNKVYSNFYYTLSFKTSSADILPSVSPVPTLPYKPDDPDFYYETKALIDKNYPLFDYVPYKTTDFSVDYLKPNVLEVILINDTPEVRQEISHWIKSKGVDPATQQIIWKKK